MRMRKNRKEEKIFPKHSIRARPGQTSPGSYGLGKGLHAMRLKAKGWNGRQDYRGKSGRKERNDARTGGRYMEADGC